MGKIITVSNQKGGVGKTTTVNSLASALRRKERQVLCVDFDPQGNLSFGLGAETDISPTIYNVLKRELSAQFAIQHTPVGDIIPANILLSGTEVEFTGQGREFLLRDALKPLRPMYDYILVDTPPGLGILTVNAFAASDALLIPLLPDMYSLQGITRIYETVQRTRSTCNPQLEIAGVFMTQYNEQQVLSREVRATVEMICRNLRLPMLKTNIRRSIALTRAQTLQADIVKYSPYNTAIADYRALVEELLTRGL